MQNFVTIYVVAAAEHECFREDDVLKIHKLTKGISNLYCTLVFCVRVWKNRSDTEPNKK